MSERIIVPLITVIGAVLLWFGAQQYLSSADSPDDGLRLPKNGVSEPVANPDTGIVMAPEAKASDDSDTSQQSSNAAQAHQPKTEIAIQVVYFPASDGNCVGATEPDDMARISFSIGSEIMRGSSMSELDKLVLRDQQCEDGQFTIKASDDIHNADMDLIRRRQDEVKYYLMQRRIPKNNMTFPDPS